MRHPFRKKAPYSHDCPHCGCELLNGMTPDTCGCGEKKTIATIAPQARQKIEWWDNVTPPILLAGFVIGLG